MEQEREKTERLLLNILPESIAGLPIQSIDHAQAVADMALDMMTTIARHTSTSEMLHLRIGINTGPVVAGVIGMKKFIYDVWGDTVNTASRMETNCVPGEIHVTQETYDKLKDAYLLTPRGECPDQGEGEH